MSVSPTLGERGQAIWSAYNAAELPAPMAALVGEIARTADTLDRMADLVGGRRESWASLVFDDMGEVHLSIDGLLAEQRNLQTVFKNLLMEARQAGLKMEGPAPKKDETEGRGGVILSLRSRVG